MLNKSWKEMWLYIVINIFDFWESGYYDKPGVCAL